MAINIEKDKIEHASDIIGDWGPFQTRIFCFATLVYFVSPFQNKAIVFYAPRIDFWCKQTPGFENATRQTCLSYDDPAIKCTEWEYDLSFYHSTMIDYYGLVCDRSWWVSVAQSSFQFGYMISSLSVGLISDRFGRLAALKLCVFLSVLAGIGQALAPNMYVFVIARVIGGIAAFGRFMSAYVLLMEYVGPSYRVKMGPLIEFGWGISAMLQPGIYYLVRDFHNMQYIATAYEAIVSIGLFKMWESPRWLLTNGHYERARHLIVTAATENGKLSTEEIEAKLVRLKAFVNSEAELDKPKQTLLDVYKEPTLLRNCLLLYVIWFAMSFVGYGIGLNIGDLGGNLFINYFVTAVGGFLIQVLLVFVVDRISRRHILILSYVLSTIFFFTMAAATSLSSIFMTVSAFAAFSAMTVVAIINYVYVAEMFPTTVRQIAMGSCGFISRLGSISGPFMREFTEVTHLSATLSIFAVMAGISGVLVYFLPETQGEEIPDTIKQSKRRASQVSNVQSPDCSACKTVA